MWQILTSSPSQLCLNHSFERVMGEVRDWSCDFSRTHLLASPGEEPQACYESREKQRLLACRGLTQEAAGAFLELACIASSRRLQILSLATCTSR